jgi:hypothetical protein
VSCPPLFSLEVWVKQMGKCNAGPAALTALHPNVMQIGTRSNFRSVLALRKILDVRDMRGVIATPLLDQ